MAKHTDFSRIFIDRPILATVLSALILVSGIMAIPSLPISEYPDVVPPFGVGDRHLPGREPRTIADTVAGPIEEAVNGVEEHDLHEVDLERGRPDGPAVTFKGGTNIDLAAMQVQNRVQQAGAAAARRPCARLGVTTTQGLLEPHHGRAPRFAQQDLRRALPVELRNCACATSSRGLPGVGQAIAFGIGNYAMRIWIDPARCGRARHLGQRHRRGDPRAECRGVPPAASGSPPTPAGSVLQVSVNAQGRLASPEAFGEIVLRAEGDESDAPQGRRAHRAWARTTTRSRSLLNNEDAAAIVIFEAPGAIPSRCLTRSARG
jgi:multidrug efflux pump subunit AcrB